MIANVVPFLLALLKAIMSKSFDLRRPQIRISRSGLIVLRATAYLQAPWIDEVV